MTGQSFKDVNSPISLKSPACGLSDISDPVHCFGIQGQLFGSHSSRRRSALWTVAVETSNCAEISRIDAPEARRRAILPQSNVSGGRPKVFPLSFALRSPALTRSWINERSNSAIAQMI